MSISHEEKNNLSDVSGSDIKFYDPPPTKSFWCSRGIHRRTTLMAEGTVRYFSYVKRWACPCQEYYWLEDELGFSPRYFNRRSDAASDSSNSEGTQNSTDLGM